MASATVTGGQTVPSTSFGPDVTTLQNALNSLSSGYTPSNTVVNKSTGTAPQPGLNIYEGDSSKVTSFVAPNAAGAVDEVLVLGTKGVSITGGSSTQLVTGGPGNDTVNLSGGMGTVLPGLGANVVNVSAGTYTVSGESSQDALTVNNANVNYTNAQYKDTLVMNGTSNVTVSSRNANPSYVKATIAGGIGHLTMGNGAVTVDSAATARIVATGQQLDVTHLGSHGLDVTVSSPNNGFGLYNISGGAVVHETAAGGTYNINLTGSDTVYLGTGTDFVTDKGSATVYGGSGLLKYTGGSGNDSIRLGSGASTVIAGSGSDTIIAQSGKTSIKGGTGTAKITLGTGATTITAGSGAETIIGGAGTSSIVGGAGADYIMAGKGASTIVAGSGQDTVVFSKTGSAGTQTTINNYGKGTTTIDLKDGGYSASDITSITKIGGNTVIKLDDKTTITLKNFTSPLTNSDFGF